jgi:hypothetical protein
MGVDRDPNAWYAYRAIQCSVLVDESLLSVNINMLGQKFTLRSDTGKELVLSCETFEQFMDVYNMVIEFKDYYEIEYHGFETNVTK